MNKLFWGALTILPLLLFGCVKSESELIGNMEGIYISAGGEQWIHLMDGYERASNCESNEVFVHASKKCVIAIDVRSQIEEGIVIHRLLVDKNNKGQKLYRLLVSPPDGSLLELN